MSIGATPSGRMTHDGMLILGVETGRKNRERPTRAKVECASSGRNRYFRKDPAVGLDKREAERRLKTAGSNRLSEGEKISPFIVSS
jgi:Cation transporter/ATPase, N-terminus